MFEKLKMLSARLDELEMRLSAPDLYDDPARAARLLRERNELEPIVEAYRAYERAQQQLADATEMLSDPDMVPDCACHTVFYYSTLKSGRRESNPHGCQTCGAVRGGYSFRGFWLGDMPFFLLNYAL